MHVSQGFEFLGYKVKQGTGHRLPASKRRGRPSPAEPLGYPPGEVGAAVPGADSKPDATESAPEASGGDRADQPVIRGWGHFYRKADVKRLFHRLDWWIEHRLYSFLAKHWRNPMWRQYPTRRLIAEFGLVRLTHLIPGLVQR